MDGERVKNFALDRIRNLVISKYKFPPVAYDVHREFRDSFGIINGTDEEAEEVILSFTPREGRYVESLPLHHSQELVLENNREIRFRYFIRPTYDFRMELLSFGDQVKVLEPADLKKTIMKQLQQALEIYK
nr:WYL domain-containing protein [Salinimicrobium profundisediminis]